MNSCLFIVFIYSHANRRWTTSLWRTIQCVYLQCILSCTWGRVYRQFIVDFSKSPHINEMSSFDWYQLTATPSILLISYAWFVCLWTAESAGGTNMHWIRSTIAPIIASQTQQFIGAIIVVDDLNFFFSFFFSILHLTQLHAWCRRNLNKLC